MAQIHHNVWQHQFTHHQRCLGAWCLLQYLARESSQSSHAQIPVKLQSSAMERREQLFAQELTHFAIARENAIFDDSFDSFQLLVIVGVVGILPRIEISRDSASCAVHSTCNYGFFSTGEPSQILVKFVKAFISDKFLVPNLVDQRFLRWKAALLSTKRDISTSSQRSNLKGWGVGGKEGSGELERGVLGSQTWERGG